MLFPDEEGIETHSRVARSGRCRVMLFPDEEGIETKGHMGRLPVEQA